MFEGAYPPGVTGAMIDDLERGDGRCCENCRHYNGDYCLREWNNADEDYKLSWRDERDPGDYCDNYDYEEG